MARNFKMYVLVGVAVASVFLYNACASAPSPTPAQESTPSSTQLPAPSPTPEAASEPVPMPSLKPVPEPSPTPTSEPMERKDITLLKMISSEPGSYTLDEDEIDQLKALNINSLRICPLYEMSSGGEFSLIGPDQYYVYMIRQARSAGLAVFLEPNFFAHGPTVQLKDQKYVEKLLEISSQWAAIAEKENVELYSPLNEPDLLFGGNQTLVTQWVQKSQEIRPLFSGYLVLKFSDLGPGEIEGIDGYDYLAFDIIWGDNRLNELRQHLETAVTKGNELKEKYGLKGFFFGELGVEKSRVSEHTQAEIFETMLEETWDKTDGYDFLGWSNLEFSFKGREGEEVIRKWFSR